MGKGAARPERREKYEVKYMRKWMEVENRVQGIVTYRRAEKAMQQKCCTADLSKSRQVAGQI
jgi:hypothetical protein